MNKAQKWTIEICLLLIIISIIIPPFLTKSVYNQQYAPKPFIHSNLDILLSTQKPTLASALSSLDSMDWDKFLTKIPAGARKGPEGWNFLWKIHSPINSNEILYSNIDFNILALEWIGIIALGSFFFLYFRKIKQEFI